MLRPVRETMGVASGPETLQWLFTGTFIATVAVLPLSGWVKRGLDLFADHPAAAMLIGSGIALLWAAVGASLGRKQSQIEASREER